MSKVIGVYMRFLVWDITVASMASQGLPPI